MTWTKLDDGFSSHPKIRALSDAAVRLHIAALNHCSTHLTDGFVADSIVRSLAPFERRKTDRTVAELVAAGLWVRVEGRPSGDHLVTISHTKSVTDMATKWRESGNQVGNQDGHLIHDYLDYQESRSKVEARREKAAQKVQRWREKRDQAPTPTTPRNPVTEQVRNQERNPAPDPTRPDPPSVGSRNTPTVDPPDLPGAEAPAEEEPPPTTHTADAITQAIWTHIAAAELARAHNDGQIIHSPTAWTARVLEPIQTTHAGTVTAWATDYDGHPTRLPLPELAAELAEQLDPRWGPLDGGHARNTRHLTATRNRIDTERAEHARLAAEDARIDAAYNALTPDQLAAHQAAVAHIDHPTLRRQAIRTRIAETIPDLPPNPEPEEHP